MPARDSFGLSILAALTALVAVPACAASPCAGVDRTLDANRSAALGHIVAQQLHVLSADILQVFRYGGWQVVYADTHVSDEVFLFFPGDPKTKHFVTMWSGGARPDEVKTVEGWVLHNASGIPVRLAECFAWHVTNDRDR